MNHKLECKRRGAHVYTLLNDSSNKKIPYILFLSETKRHRVINLHSDMGDEEAAYRAVQIRSNDSLRGGMISMIKIGLHLETAEIVRMYAGDEFAQAIVLADKK